MHRMSLLKLVIVADGRCSTRIPPLGRRDACRSRTTHERTDVERRANEDQSVPVLYTSALVTHRQ